MDKKKAILVVHPFTSEKVLYHTIKSRNYKIITLVTSLDKNWIEHCYSTLEAFNDYMLHASDDIQADILMIQKLLLKENLELKGVINAFDSSVVYADSLANFFLKTELDLKYGHIRCNKYLTNSMLEHSQVRCIKSFLLKAGTNILDSESIIKAMNFPLIIKPTNLSVARSNVMVANDFSSVLTIVDQLFATKNVFNGEAITEIMIQEFIQGEEWVVNTASYRGKYHIAGVFKYKKDKNRLLEIISLDNKEDNSLIDELIKYNNKCLDALKVSYGITHNEFIIDSEGTPYLIEVNNRLSGVELPMLSQKCYGTDEVSTFLDLIEGGEVQTFDLNRVHAYAKVLGLSNFNNQDATTINLNDISSEHEIIMFRPGVVSSTPEEDSSLFVKISAGLWLLNHDKAILDEEAHLLFRREQDGSLFI